MGDKSRMIQLAVDSGITDLRTIRDVFNSYAEGGLLKNYRSDGHLFGPGGFTRRQYNGENITEERYKEIQRQLIIDAAVQKALTRDEGVAPVINGKLDESCLYTVTDNFGKKYRVAGNQAFLANPGKYGFAFNGPIENAGIGTLYQFFEPREDLGRVVPHHMALITGYDDAGNPLISYSHGNAGLSPKEKDYKRNAPIWDSYGYETYKFVGTPEDNLKWEQEYNNLPVVEMLPQLQFNNLIGNIEYGSRGKIHIKPENRGKFTALKKRTGYSARRKHKDGGILFDMGGGIFGKKPIFLGELPEAQITSSENVAPGTYLPKEYRDFYANYSNYDDYKSKAVIPEDRAGEAEAMAQYYYNNNPVYADYYKFTSGPYRNYQKLRNQYTRSKEYMVDMTKGNTYRLKSIDSEGKPTNKHTMSVNEGLLDYIYKEAKRGGVDPKEAIALAVNESNLGNSRQSDGKVGVFDLLSYWAGTGAVLYPNSKVIDPHKKINAKIRNGERLTAEDRKTIQELNKAYSKMAESIHPYEGDNVVADAVKYFNAGKYPGVAAPQERIDAYRQVVLGRFDELMNDPRFVKWWNSKK